MEDETLLSRLRSGDEELLKIIYTQYREDFLKWIFSRHAINQEHAIELFQESIVILFENAVRGNINNSNLNIKSYLISIAKHKLREEVRAKKKSKMANGPIYQLWIAPADVPEEELKVIEQCLSELGDSCRQILRMFYYYGMDISSIAKRLNYKNNDTCKSMKSKCLRKLRERVNVQLQKRKNDERS